MKPFHVIFYRYRLFIRRRGMLYILDGYIVHKSLTSPSVEASKFWSLCNAQNIYIGLIKPMNILVISIICCSMYQFSAEILICTV